MRELPRAMTVAEHENCCREVDEIARAWIAYERRETFKEGAEAAAYAEALQSDWAQRRPRLEWKEFCEPALLKELAMLEQS